MLQSSFIHKYGAPGQVRQRVFAPERTRNVIFSPMWIGRNFWLKCHKYFYETQYSLPVFNCIFGEKVKSTRSHKQLLKCSTVESVFAEKWKLYYVLAFHLLHFFASCRDTSEAIILQIVLSFSIANLLLTVIRTWWRGLCRCYAIVDASVILHATVLVLHPVGWSIIW